MRTFAAIVLALALAASDAFAPRSGFLSRVNAARAPGVPALSATVASPVLPETSRKGVVTGKKLDDLLEYAQAKGFAIPGVNIVGKVLILLLPFCRIL